MIVLFGCEKGGVGKSTLATNLAALRVARGGDVILVDTDLQGSASAWTSERDDDDSVPRVACMAKMGRGLSREVQSLAGKYADVVLDCGGKDSEELRGGMVAADVLYIPIRPSQPDVWCLDRMDELVTTARGFNPDLIARVIINCASTNPSVTEADEVRSVISDFPALELSDVIIKDRIAFRRAFRSGLSVSELVPEDKKAVYEIVGLYDEVFND